MKWFFWMGLGITTLVAAVDINHATVEELSALHGVGEAKAKRIVAYRESHCFQSIDELSQVKGIGEKTVAKNKKELTLSACQ